MLGRIVLGLVLLIKVSTIVPVRGCEEGIGNIVYTNKGCGLTEIPTNIPNDTLVIVIEENNISRLRSGVFQNFQKCFFLEFKKNHLAVIENGSFTGLNYLKILRLDENNIRDLPPGLFHNLQILQSLQLGNNQLTEIKSGTFKGLTKLHYIELSNNQISSIEAGAFDNLPKLYDVHLNSNQLTTFSRDVLASGNEFPTFSLGNNPFVCNSDMCWLKDDDGNNWISYSSRPSCTNYPDQDWYDIELDCN